MNGNEIYEATFLNKVDRIIQSNSDLTFLSGYTYFINSLSPTTIYNYTNYIILFMRHANKDVKDIALDDYTKFLSSIRGKTSSYQIAVYSALKKFSEYLLANGTSSVNPMKYVARPKFVESDLTKKKREVGYLEEEEIKHYLNVVNKGTGSYKARIAQTEWRERDVLIVQIFLNTGMRCSALYKLNVENIDLKNKMLITIDKGNKIQEYSMSDELINHVKKWLDKRELLLDNERENALFISNRRRRMDQSSISNVVKKYASGIQGKHITPHKLRATYGTQLYEKTGDLYFVQSCMNHNNPKTTEIYIRGQKEGNRKKAASIMEQLTK